jgi:hypothetical protein
VNARDLFLFFMPPTMKAETEDESRRWVARCPRCQRLNSIWDAGGMRYKAAGSGGSLARCAHCGKTGFTRFEKIEPLSPRDEQVFRLILRPKTRTTQAVMDIALRLLREDGISISRGAEPDVIEARDNGIEEVHFGYIANHKLDQLIAYVDAGVKIRWERWIEALSDPGFVMAWMPDEEYDHWQNATHLDDYTAAGRAYNHLPLKSNGLPYPVEETIVDTSGNPGRWTFRTGFVEAVASPMWLGDAFWELTGADRRLVEAADWLRVSHPAEHVMRIDSAEAPFTSAQGQSGETQRRLRALFYPG